VGVSQFFMAVEYAMFMKRYVRHKITSSPNFKLFFAESLWARLKIKKRSKNGPNAYWHSTMTRYMTLGKTFT
jgi:hypothetical protein